MNSFWYSLADCFQSVFDLMPNIGSYINRLLFVTGFVSTAYWIFYMVRNPKGRDNYLSK